MFPYTDIIPNIGESTIITMEKAKEFTDISVALWSDGIIVLSRISVLTWTKLSEKAPIKPPIIIR